MTVNLQHVDEVFRLIKATSQTFDQLRDTPRLSTCGQHAYTGGGHGLGCPWRREQSGRWGVVWAQPDREARCE